MVTFAVLAAWHNKLVRKKISIYSIWVSVTSLLQVINLLEENAQASYPDTIQCYKVTECDFQWDLVISGDVSNRGLRNVRIQMNANMEQHDTVTTNWSKTAEIIVPV